jgi:hypothetical protein
LRVEYCDEAGPRIITNGRGFEQPETKGYAEEDFHDTLRRYVPRSEVDAILAEFKQPDLVRKSEAAAGMPANDPATQQPSDPPEVCNSLAH